MRAGGSRCTVSRGGGAAGAYAGGVPGGAGHCAGSGVDPEVVAVVAVFDVGFAYDGFDDGSVVEKWSRSSNVSSAAPNA